MTETQNQFENLEKRLRKLEEKPDGWSLTDWLKFIGIVVSLIAGGLGLFDTLYLKPLREADESRSAAREQMAQFEQMNERIYVMKVEGKDRQISAFEEAARQAIRDGINTADQLTRAEQKREMLVKIGGYRLFFETYHKADCDLANKVAMAVDAYALPLDTPFEISAADRAAQQYLELHRLRCG